MQSNSGKLQSTGESATSCLQCVCSLIAGFPQVEGSSIPQFDVRFFLLQSFVSMSLKKRIPRVAKVKLSRSRACVRAGSTYRPTDSSLRPKKRDFSGSNSAATIIIITGKICPSKGHCTRTADPVRRKITEDIATFSYHCKRQAHCIFLISSCNSMADLYCNGELRLMSIALKKSLIWHQEKGTKRSGGFLSERKHYRFASQEKRGLQLANDEYKMRNGHEIKTIFLIHFPGWRANVKSHAEPQRRPF